MDRVTVRMMARLLLHLVLSAVLAIVTEFFLFVFGDWATMTFTLLRPLREIARSIMFMFSDQLLFIVLWIMLFVMYLLLLQWRHFRYFSQIGRAVSHIAEGHFDYQIPVKQNNELGQLAANTNWLVTQLKKSLDDERRAEQTKNELITNVSHDLRTPLTSVLGYLGLIEQDRYRDEIELRHYVQIAYEKSKRLNVLINDLFEYTRMRNDAVPILRDPLNLTEMLGELLVQYHVPLQEAGMTGHLHAVEKVVTVKGDAVKLVRVFENLLANAIAYGRDGKRVDVFLKKEEPYAVVEIVNYGEPIPAVDLPNIFDRFYRGDKSRTSRADSGGGSGLGLAIAKEIVEKHGGAIGVASDSTRTAFQVRLPLAPREERQTEQAVPASQQAGKK
ncbi:sensor histidine kinase [Paenibacillus sp. 32O-W]|uniref:sensor histidine kinase n=1 Tax=Paenibacillus sp. 32O-W TaxID=1695218 RepID=UPI0009EA1EB3|nr:HAMP domain-containing sensor histidine kinase [Paenibacillus sp. 32O-W]